jgi:hypothetical protein
LADCVRSRDRSALLPWSRIAACVGLVILSPFAVASFRLLIEIARVRDAD